MSVQVINTIKPKFTKDQELAINGILEFINNEWANNNFIYGLIGAGGTGKTFITKYIISNNKKYANSAIKCTSPTHKACRVFSNALGGKEVYTIQSTFGLRLNLKLEDFDPTNPQFDPTASPKLDDVRLLMIDEASMLPAKLVNFIISTCRVNRIKILFIGDDFQLAPVNERRSIAFTKCNKVFRLTQIVRQGESNPIKDLLNLLRNDIANNENKFIDYIIRNIGVTKYNSNKEGYTICGANQFNNLIDISFNDEEYTRNIDMLRIVGYTNKCIAEWNKYIRNKIIEDADKNIITKNDLIMSYNTIVNEFNDIIINNSEEYIIKDIVDYVDDKYEFKGFLIKFQLVHGGDITKPLFVLDHTDKFTIINYHNIVNKLIEDAKSANGATRVEKWRRYYKFKDKYLIAANILDNRGNILHSRDLDYGFAITSHKSQGSTYDTVFVDLNDMMINKNGMLYTDRDDLLRRIYVACSRAKKDLIICYGK